MGRKEWFVKLKWQQLSKISSRNHFSNQSLSMNLNLSLHVPRPILPKLLGNPASVSVLILNLYPTQVLINFGDFNWTLGVGSWVGWTRVSFLNKPKRVDKKEQVKEIDIKVKCVKIKGYPNTTDVFIWSKQILVHIRLTWAAYPSVNTSNRIN